MIAWGGFDWSMLSEGEKKYLTFLVVFCVLLTIITLAMDWYEKNKQKKDQQ